MAELSRPDIGENKFDGTVRQKLRVGKCISINIPRKTNYCFSFTTTEYVVFSYKSGRFARSLAIHRTRPALRPR